MDIALSFMSVRRTGRLLAILTLAAALVVISLAPVAVSAETTPPATPVFDNGSSGDIQSAAVLNISQQAPTVVSVVVFSARGDQMPWGGIALLGAVLGTLAVSKRRSQR